MRQTIFIFIISLLIFASCKPETQKLPKGYYREINHKNPDCYYTFLVTDSLLILNPTSPFWTSEYVLSDSLKLPTYNYSRFISDYQIEDSGILVNDTVKWTYKKLFSGRDFIRDYGSAYELKVNPELMPLDCDYIDIDSIESGRYLIIPIGDIRSCYRYKKDFSAKFKIRDKYLLLNDYVADDIDQIDEFIGNDLKIVYNADRSITDNDLISFSEKLADGYRIYQNYFYRIYLDTLNKTVVMKRLKMNY